MLESVQTISCAEARRALAAGTFSGLLTLLALPGFDAWPLAFVSLTPLSIHWRKSRSWAEATMSAACWGLVTWGVALAWLPSSLAQYLQMPTSSSWLIGLLVILWQTTPMALAASLHYFLRGCLSEPWSFAVSWLVAAAVVPIPLPYSFSSALVACPALLAPVWLGGRICLDALLLFGHACFGLALVPSVSKLRGPRLIAGWMALWIALSLARSSQPEPDSGMRKLLLVQAGAEDSAMSSSATRIRRHILATNERFVRDLDLIVWGETVISDPIRANQLSAPPLLESSLIRWDVPLLSGVVTRAESDRATNGLVRNSALLFPRGSVRACDACRIDKQLVVPVAEAADGVASLFGATKIPKFTVGPVRTPLHVEGLRLGVLICYEAAFAARIGDQVEEGVDLMINLVSDDWVHSKVAREMHRAHASLAAVEAGRTLVRLASGGPSVVVTPDGVSSHLMSEGYSGAAIAHVPIQRVEAPYRNVVLWLRNWLAP